MFPPLASNDMTVAPLWRGLLSGRYERVRALAPRQIVSWENRWNFFVKLALDVN
jgi:hypothetical protein